SRQRSELATCTTTGSVRRHPTARVLRQALLPRPSRLAPHDDPRAWWSAVDRYWAARARRWTDGLRRHDVPAPPGGVPVIPVRDRRLGIHLVERRRRTERSS